MVILPAMYPLTVLICIWSNSTALPPTKSYFVDQGRTLSFTFESGIRSVGSTHNSEAKW